MRPKSAVELLEDRAANLAQSKRPSRLYAAKVLREMIALIREQEAGAFDEEGNLR